MLLLRSAYEPTFIYRGSSQIRTHERWVELYEEGSGKFTVIFGNDRGTIRDIIHDNIDDANYEFEQIKTECGMKEDIESKKLKQLLKPERVVFT